LTIVPNVRHLRIQLATIGIRGMAKLAFRNRLRRPLRSFAACQELLEGASALEIGGPSTVFGRHALLPVYPLLRRLDNCDFARTTIWHGEDGARPSDVAGDTPSGRRFVTEGTDLAGIGDATYDAVLASHVLEHVANPLRALAEWRRVTRPDGGLVLVVPHLEHTIDHRRPVTALEHLEEDLARSTGEDDPTHVQEFLELADLERDPEPLTRGAFEERTRSYADNRAIHHHVFDTDLVVRVLDRARYQLVAVEPALPFHVVAVARAADRPANEGFLSASATWRRTSVFRRDRALYASTRS
jgi:SAM-dependent methyltransferase